MTVERPWGNYTVIDHGEGFQVKRIIVHPGQRLSYQSHKLRSEHWTIISGKGLVTLDGKEQDVNVGDMISIQSGIKHRMQNVGEEDLSFIEVQRGSYFGEDDIVRYDDDYGREGTTEPGEG